MSIEPEIAPDIPGARGRTDGAIEAARDDDTVILDRPRGAESRHRRAGRPADEHPPAPARTRRRRWLIAGAVVLALLAMVGIGGYVGYAPAIARGTAVLGVDIGGLERAEAVTRLRERLRNQTAAMVPVQVGSATGQLQPADAGLAVDVEATVAAADRIRPNPLSALFGRRDVPPVITVDQAKLHAVLQPLVGDQGTPPVLPAIRYQQLTPVAVYPTTGLGLDPAASARAVRAQWLRQSTVDIPLVQLEPAMSNEAVDQLVNDMAKPAVAAPILASTAKGELTVAPEAIAASLLLEAGPDGRIAPRFDQAKLAKALAEPLKAVQTTPKNATIAIRGGAPVVTPHVDGQTVDLAALAAAMLPVLGQPAPRRVTATIIPSAPKITTARVNELGIIERVSTFTTNFQAGQSRTVNIKRMADTVRGAIVLPGEVFSINAFVGERTYAKGYVDAPVIDNGKIKNAPGGGVSQFATTTFNAMYYAGLEDVEHKPHSYYFSRYPAVIEATLVYPSLDLKFRNNSPYGVLIDTAYTNTSVTVSMWSTKRFDISTVYGPRTNITQPRTVYLQEDDCNATTGLPGFAQEAFRVFKQNGQEVRRERFAWRYDAEPKFICGPPPPTT